MILDYVALGIMIFLVITFAYAIIYIHDIPYELAKKRNHPHQDAIHVAGWVSLFTLHVIWPFLWIWAMMYRPDRGYGTCTAQDDPAASDASTEQLSKRIAALEEAMNRNAE